MRTARRHTAILRRARPRWRHSRRVRDVNKSCRTRWRVPILMWRCATFSRKATHWGGSEATANVGTRGSARAVRGVSRPPPGAPSVRRCSIAIDRCEQAAGQNRRASLLCIPLHPFHRAAGGQDRQPSPADGRLDCPPNGRRPVRSQHRLQPLAKASETVIHCFMDHQADVRSRDVVLGPPLCRIYERSAAGPLPPMAPALPLFRVFVQRGSKMLG
jgi:hypothetical protein